MRKPKSTLDQWRADQRRLEREGYPVRFDETRAATLRAWLAKESHDRENSSVGQRRDR